VIVTALVVGLVSISALLVQASFREEELRAGIGQLELAQEGLTRDVADLTSPGRIAAWAEAEGMLTPERVITLELAPRRGGARDGGAT
jgi:cell division protein FtsL